ncbi:F-box/kelch-repeat protein At3g23880 [Medicago truncatula]|uniref:F-box protein interaction domain protein n=1 Tax=Medicago truncatula TaxID=3880 RepID=G7IK34_MEDTR|nr:F-box/kelch-repeat protein At3g23880 [Medicago truncatula]AES63644.1 F-box protein interaction domain protein [Medicago truncatula]
MSNPPTKSSVQPNAEFPVSLSYDLIVEILSFSDVKSLMQMRCVCKSWKSIISDHEFIKLHLKRSARNPYLTLSRGNTASKYFPFPVHRLILENPLILLPENLCYRCQDMYCRYAIGSCNGMFCLIGYSYLSEPGEFWFRFWNPVIRIMSKKLGHILCHDMITIHKHYKFTFVYDNSSETYKVVLLMLDVVQNRTHVQVLNVADNVWKTIPNFPAVPLPNQYTGQGGSDGVYLNGRLNWLAIQNRPVSVDGWENIKAKEFVIVSLYMGTESYTQLMPPSGFDEMSSIKPPSLCILKDSLCFSHDYRRTEFIIWQMKIIGVEEPWTQLLKISYQNLRTRFHDFADLKNCQLLPLHLSDHNDTLILANNQEQRAILYNLRNNTAKRTRIIDEIQWFSAKVYVESLVSDI